MYNWFGESPIGKIEKSDIQWKEFEKYAYKLSTKERWGLWEYSWLSDNNVEKVEDAANKLCRHYAMSSVVNNIMECAYMDDKQNLRHAVQQRANDLCIIFGYISQTGYLSEAGKKTLEAFALDLAHEST